MIHDIDYTDKYNYLNMAIPLESWIFKLNGIWQ